MSNNATNQFNWNQRPGAQQPQVFFCKGWTVYDFETLGSTNLAAAKLPAWSAIRAKTQTAGRGRFQRNWISDTGGLWLSAVVPTGSSPDWRCLPLAVGLAICQTLDQMGTPGMRMRWPNDILVDDKKLAGLLIDKFSPDLAVAGIGINVFNQPEAGNPALQGLTTRVADLLAGKFPTLTSNACAEHSNEQKTEFLNALTQEILIELQAVIIEMQTGGFSSLHTKINALWGSPRMVEIDLDGEKRRGMFAHVDKEGRLALLDATGNFTFFHSHEVRHLTELNFLK